MESDCCGAYTDMTEYGICPECLEHCEFIDEDEEEQFAIHAGIARGD